MNVDNQKLIRSIVNLAGDYLKDKLPPHPNHPERNAYAHIWRSIKEKFGKTYKDLDDSQVLDIVCLVTSIKEHYSTLEPPLITPETLIKCSDGVYVVSST